MPVTSKSKKEGNSMSYFYDGESDLFFIYLANIVVAKVFTEEEAISFINNK